MVDLLGPFLGVGDVAAVDLANLKFCLLRRPGTKYGEIYDLA